MWRADEAHKAGKGRGRIPAPCRPPPEPPGHMAVSRGTQAGRTPPTLLLAWPVTGAQTGQKDTGPVHGGSDVSTSDQASQPLSVALAGASPRCLNYARGRPHGWQMAAHEVTGARGRRAVQEGRTSGPCHPTPSGWRTYTRAPLLPPPVCYEGQSLHFGPGDVPVSQ